MALTKLLILAVALSLSLFGFNSVAGLANTSEQSCEDLVVLFLRGSGQPMSPGSNYNEDNNAEFFTFQESIEQKLPADTSYSIVDIPYPAEAVGYESFRHIANSFDAEFWWSPGGRYRSSVAAGEQMILDEFNNLSPECQGQTKFALAGYSQGAQVVGQAVKQLTYEQQSWVFNISLFGDPKRHGFDEFVNSYGSAPAKTNGILEARIPYFNSGLGLSVYAWCENGDGICTNSLKVGSHSIYSEMYTQFAGQKLVNEFLAIKELEQANAPIDPTAVRTLVGSYMAQDSKPQTLVLVVDRSKSMTETLDQMRTPELINQFTATLSEYFADRKVGVVSYGEMRNYNQTPRVELSPTTNLGLVGQAIANIQIENVPNELPYDWLGGDNNTAEDCLPALLESANLVDDFGADVMVFSDASCWHTATNADRTLMFNDVLGKLAAKDIRVHTQSEGGNGGSSKLKWLSDRFGGFRTTGFNITSTTGLVLGLHNLGLFLDESPLTAFDNNTLYVEPDTPVAIIPNSKPGYYWHNSREKRPGLIRRHEWQVYDRSWNPNSYHQEETSRNIPLTYTFPRGFDGFVRVKTMGSDFRWGSDIVHVVTRSPVTDNVHGIASPVFSLSQVGSNAVRVTLGLGATNNQGVWQLHNSQGELMGTITGQMQQFLIKEVPTGKEVGIVLGGSSGGQTAATITLEEGFAKAEDNNQNHTNIPETTPADGGGVINSFGTNADNTPHNDTSDYNANHTVRVLGDEAKNNQTVAVHTASVGKNPANSTNLAAANAEKTLSACSLFGCNISKLQTFTLIVAGVSGLSVVGYLVFRLKP